VWATSRRADNPNDTWLDTRAGSPLAKPTRAGVSGAFVRASECLASARGLGLGSNDTHHSVNRLTRQF
jgi:hypothetical protein